VVRRLGVVGERPETPDESFTIVEGAVSLHLDFSYPPQADAEARHEIRIFAESTANAYAALTFVRSAEASDTNATILICDDDEGIRMLVRRVLERAGFQVIEAPNGLIGYARALEFRPDLIIIDWVMPVLDGHDTVIRLKADPFTSPIPIVMLTSRSLATDTVAALNAGVNDFLAKPFAPAKLTEAIRQQLRWRKLLADENAAVVPHALPRERIPDTQSLATFLEIAEAAEERQAYDDAAQAYMRAADLSGNPDMANKFRRLSGKMYLLLAESASDSASIQRGYSSAARAFLAAGNLALAQTAHRSATA